MKCRIALLICSALSLASAANADEIRVHGVGYVTVYDGAVTAISPDPQRERPNEIRFTADSSVTFGETIRPAVSIPKTQAWTVYINTPDGPLMIECFGNVPAFLGNTFAFDVACRQ